MQPATTEIDVKSITFKYKELPKKGDKSDVSQMQFKS
jgi:hypothetical protein